MTAYACIARFVFTATTLGCLKFELLKRVLPLWTFERYICNNTIHISSMCIRVTVRPPSTGHWRPAWSTSPRVAHVPTMTANGFWSLRSQSYLWSNSHRTHRWLRHDSELHQWSPGQNTAGQTSTAFTTSTLSIYLSIHLFTSSILSFLSMLFLSSISILPDYVYFICPIYLVYLYVSVCHIYRIHLSLRVLERAWGLLSSNERN